MKSITTFKGANGLDIVADAAGPEDGLPVVLLHGGGQTRGSWKNGLAALAAIGYRVFAYDARGHGDSGWAPDGAYAMTDLTADLRSILDQLPPRAALVGASMGGVTSLTLFGQNDHPDVRALVLVDVGPRINAEGSRRIVAFMRAHPGGFSSLEEAADAVSAYNPHRPRPRDPRGLLRNLRVVDGRYFWHWDPAFLGDRHLEPQLIETPLDDVARGITVPTLLVRGAESDIVGDEEVASFRTLMPRAEYVDVAGAGHMIAGDRNDAFNAAIIDFLCRVDMAAADTAANMSHLSSKIETNR